MVSVMGIPNPLTVVTDVAGDVAGRAAQPIVHGIATTVLGWLADACRTVGAELVAALSGPASPRFETGWWASPQARELMKTVGVLAATLAVGFLFLALLQGLLAGDPLGMLRSALGHVPLSALGMAVVVAVTDVLLRVTDEATALVLHGTPENLAHFVSGFGVQASLITGGLAAGVLMAVFLIGALLVWAELVVRSALVYLLVAFAPLVLAARIWPAARGMFRRLCELGLALIVSKLAIALALAVGAVALGADDGVGRPGGGLSLAGLMGGATLMGLAAFTPFVVLRLLPLLETAVVAQGISRSPMRGAQTAMAASAYPVRLARLAVGPTGSATPTGPRALPAGSSIPLPSGAGGDRPVRPGQRPGGSAGPGRPSTAPAPWHPPHRPPRRPGRWS
ncbi:MAG TPA: hypothetical protein VFE55_14515 [Acidimicrobiia bacterium]|nr:hypothetical protein [Acidimicrobiia bacterium]